MAEQFRMGPRWERGRIPSLTLLHPVPSATTTTTPTPSDLERGDSSSSRRRSSTAAIAIATVTDAITAAYAAVTAPAIKH
ncbi:uncharacterized protein TRIVIDRAFT_225116 [Trichoderma virens Gv29-8]|uniref:Uncharacterized protein n=1 Tax=Hypocrea virens (strain Gv29-8 / FGSC 10586) TaxID=413071 RepID=G9N2D3_HYPVG|nr:uncharacterized protein TRIVIDRAFT_225116 [Trichoderma virens Gv29-8]EHK19246.1 hypothetical protein TRIVIDRAFT_225116 [Trichoderma virens Gv29-8]UKZ49301.1 hypothetical protein TrVGV298_003546 [Trichoderma virens]